MTQNWEKDKEMLLEGLSGKKREITAVLLENTRKNLNETAAAGVTATGNFARWEKVVMPLVRRTTPATIATELVGVQPMAAPVGIVNALRVRYADTVATGGPTAGAEASGVNVYEKYSLIAAGEAYTASDARTAAQITAALESQGGYEMNLDVVKQSIEAKTRKLQAKWTIEADQDAKALHGIDLESELVSALSDEVIREMDREIITNLINLAGTVKAFDFTFADGRYAAEKYTALSIGISDLSNQIAVKTKRGGASWMVVTPNVLTALRHASSGAFVAATGDVSAMSSLFVGTYNGNIRVYLDLYAASDYVMLGYKGSSELDTGYVYSPYIPLMQSQAVIDPTSYDPRISIMTRYALTAFTDTATSLGNSADYYARGTVSNLKLGFTN